jgi:hypothetical protein
MSERSPSFNSIVLAMLAAVFSWMIRETRDTQGAAAPAAA